MNIGDIVKLTGDIVKLTDGSWSKSITIEERLTHTFPACTHLRRWILIAKGSKQKNNCVIIDTEFTEVVFTQKRFLQVVESRIPDKVRIVASTPKGGLGGCYGDLKWIKEIDVNMKKIKGMVGVICLRMEIVLNV